jgi:CheY-like chemotaxis protein/two-component sensor histidine kinase
MQVELHPVVVADEALEVMELFRESARDKGLEMNFSVDDDARDAIARLDAGALNSALQNLISNAIKFTSDGHVHVHVSISTSDVSGDAAPSDLPHIGVHVRDTGIGIGDEFRPYLFEDFRQESDGLTREHEGSGLGLSIAKQLVEAMNGRIEVSSEPGEGSTFSVLFPLQEEQRHEPEAPAEERPAQPEPTDARVLLVEDNDNNIFLVKDLLESTVDLEVATSASDAMQQAANLDFDMLLVDINLGAGGSGVDLLHTLRERPSYADTPIVAVTAIAMPGDRERILSAGFNDYLAKPFESADLLELLHHYLDLPRRTEDAGAA